MEQNQPIQPLKVYTAVMLLYLSLVIEVFRSFMEASMLGQMASPLASPSSFMFVALISLGFTWFFIHMISKGHNWARITFLVLFIIGTPFFVPHLLHNSGLYGIGQLIIQTVAMVFLFQKPSSDWFREMKRKRHKYELAETKKMWENEVDDYLFKAATKDLNKYSEEVQHIIIEETQKRELVDSNGRSIEKSLGTCKNHPEIQAEDRCADCMEVFCSDCLNVIVDEKYCSSCNSDISRKEATLPCEEASSALKYAIIGFFIIGIILEPIAISKALKAKDMIKANPSLSGSRKVTAALIIAIVYILGFIIFFSVINLNR